MEEQSKRIRRFMTFHKGSLPKRMEKEIHNILEGNECLDKQVLEELKLLEAI